jgi:hypothetical protein
MSIDPEKMKGGASDQQVNTRVSDDAREVIDYLQFVDGYPSRGAWVLSCIARVIEAEAPGIRKELEKPEIAEHGPSRLTETLEALDRLCPPEE